MTTAFSITAKAEAVANFRAKIRDLHNSSFPVWEMERLTAFVEFAIQQLSPLQVGDVAILAKAPEITPEKSWGWLGSKHTLVAGKRGVIRSVDWDEGWWYSWEPEAQTWIAQDGTERPVDRPSLFNFREQWLEKPEGEGGVDV